VIPAFLGLTGASGRADAADDNPWDAHTLEWGTPSPAPADNYADTPTVMSPEPLLDLKAAPDFATGEESGLGGAQKDGAS
jgi:heme/copper-type cytochrome/quinol oxidase subunit 1